jgi:transcription elongation GreA/GreB family factor
MQLPETLKAKAPSELEGWFLEQLDGEGGSARDMVAVLLHLAKQGAVEQAENLADLLQEVGLDNADPECVRMVLCARATWRQDDAFRRVCEQTLGQVYRGRLELAFVKACGLGAEVPVEEALRRLGVLIRMEPGRFCHDKTWGFGVVQRVDDFYSRVTVDFDSKRGHQMSFAYAGETLELVGENHLLAIRHQAPERLDGLVRDNPAEVVRMALRDFGPMTAPILKDTLVDGIVAEADWKRFWDTARKDLKRDGLVDLPGKRNDPIRLLDREKQYDDAWFEGLDALRDPEAIWEACRELEREGVVGALEPDHRSLLARRIAFAIRGAEDSAPDLAARLVMFAEQAGVEDDALDVARATRELMAGDRLVRVVNELPARETGPLLAYLSGHDAPLVAQQLCERIPQFTASALNDVIAFLDAQGKRDDVVSCLQNVLRARLIEPEPLLWLCAHQVEATGWCVAPADELLSHALDVMESGQHAARSRVMSQLRSCFEDGAWLEAMLDTVDPARREAIFRRITVSRAWEASARRSVLAHFLRLYPELADVLADGEGRDDVQRRPLTSWRSYRQRSAQLKKLVEKDIPENSREIALARSYGDLRENFEYQAAKDHQALLMAQKAELERDLEHVQGTDFQGLATHVAGMGTRVVVERPNGSLECYHILGEWDRDEALGIIASSSRMARQLAGYGAGDAVTLPSEEGDEACRLVEVGPLSDAVREWLG